MNNQFKILNSEMIEAKRSYQLKIIEKIRENSVNIKDTYSKYMNSHTDFLSMDMFKGQFKYNGKWVFIAIWLIMTFSYYLTSLFLIAFLNRYPNNSFLVLLILSLIYSASAAFVISLASALPLKNPLRILKKYHYYYLFSVIVIFIVEMVSLYILPVLSISIIHFITGENFNFYMYFDGLPVGYGLFSLLSLIVLSWFIYRISFFPSAIALSEDVSFWNAFWLAWKLTGKCGECLTLYIKSALMIIIITYISTKCPNISVISPIILGMLMTLPLTLIMPAFTMHVANYIFKNGENLIDLPKRA